MKHYSTGPVDGNLASRKMLVISTVFNLDKILKGAYISYPPLTFSKFNRESR